MGKMVLHKEGLRRFISILLLLLLSVGFTACGGGNTATNAKEGGLTEIHFSDFFTRSPDGTGIITEKMWRLNGKKVGIKGYMTELTPIDNRFIYLVPKPGASCPFCSADNPRYLEAIAVYPPNGDEFPYTEQGLWVYGTLEVGEEVDQATGLVSMFRLRADSIEPYQER